MKTHHFSLLSVKNRKRFLQWTFRHPEYELSSLKWRLMGKSSDSSTSNSSQQGQYSHYQQALTLFSIPKLYQAELNYMILLLMYVARIVLRFMLYVFLYQSRPSNICNVLSGWTLETITWMVWSASCCWYMLNYKWLTDIISNKYCKYGCNCVVVISV